LTERAALSVVMPGLDPGIHPETVIPGREQRRANPESRTVHGAGFRVCAQEGASRNDGFIKNQRSNIQHGCQGR
jgi:hypothetical protein